MSAAPTHPPDRPEEVRTALRWEYAPAPEATAHLRLRERYDLFLDGRFQEPEDGHVVETLNPATEEPIAEVAFGGPHDVDRAVSAARRALPAWAALPGL